MYSTSFSSSLVIASPSSRVIHSSPAVQTRNVRSSGAAGPGVNCGPSVVDHPCRAGGTTANVSASDLGGMVFGMQGQTDGRRIVDRPGLNTPGEDAAWDGLRERVAITLRPIGAPTSIGFFGLAAATLCVAGLQLG